MYFRCKEAAKGGPLTCALRVSETRRTGSGHGSSGTPQWQPGQHYPTRHSVPVGWTSAAHTSSANPAMICARSTHQGPESHTHKKYYISILQFNYLNLLILEKGTE